MKERYEAYLKAMKNKWSESTLRSESFRLKGITKDHLLHPDKLYKYLYEIRGLSRYALKTAFIRASQFSEWLVEKGDLPSNKVQAWYEEHVRKFKHAYSKREVTISFAEAVERINQIEIADIRQKALQLLMTGMRYTESTSLNKHGQVVGKGNIVRTVPLAEQFDVKDFKKGYGAVYKQLKKVGLTPHMLRKICATEHAKQGATEADLMNILGWRTSNMAHLYVQAQRTRALTDALSDKLTQVRKGRKSGKQIS